MKHDGERLKAIFKAKGLKNYEIAKMIGVTRQTVSVDIHEVQLSRDRVRKYAQALQFNMNEFYGVQNNEPEQNPSLSVRDELLTTKDELIQVLREVISDLRKRLNDKDEEVNFFEAGNLVNKALPC